MRPGGGEIHDPVNHDRGGFLPPVGVELDREGEAQPADIPAVDIRQGAEALFVIGTAIAEPIVRVGIGGKQPFLVDPAIFGLLPAGRERE